MTSNFTIEELMYCRLNLDSSLYDVTGESGATNLYIKTGMGSIYLTQLKDFNHLKKLWFLLTGEKIKFKQPFTQTVQASDSNIVSKSDNLK